MAIRFDQIQLSDDGNHLYPYIEGTDGYLAVQTASGLLRIGAGNSSYSHFFTDRNTYYFNRAVSFDGNIAGYDGNETASFAIYYDSNDTSYYVNPASTSNLNDVEAVQLAVDSYIYHKGDTDTYFGFGTTDSIRFVAGNSEILLMTSNTLTIGDGMDDKAIIHGHLGIGNNPYPKIAYPGQNALWSGSGSTTGQIVIDLPGTLANYDMMYMEIDIYEYSGVGATKLIVGGHNWNSGGNSNTSTTQWYNVNVQVIGALSKPIYFGRRNDGTNERRCIAIGETTSTWSYATVHVHKVHGAEFYSTAIDWVGDWNIAQTTSTSYFTKNPTTDFNANNSYTLESNGIIEANMLFGQASVRSPIFYDLDDTTYYLNPASDSVLHGIGIDDYLFHNGDGDTHLSFDINKVILTAGNGKSRFRVLQTEIEAGQEVGSNTQNYSTKLRLQGKNNYSNGTNWYGNYGQLIFNASSNMTGSARRYLFTNAYQNNQFAIVQSADATTDPSVNDSASGVNSGDLVMSWNNSRDVTIHSQTRSPIFYDSNNTGYYVNPASDSQMNQIHLADYVRHLGDLDTYFGFNGADQWKLHLGGGDRLIATTSQFTSNLHIHAPIYYDKDNTNFYANPGGTSILSSIETLGIKINTITNNNLMGYHTNANYSNLYGYLGVDVNGKVGVIEKEITFSIEGSGWVGRHSNPVKLLEAPGADKMIVVQEINILINYTAPIGIGSSGICRTTDNTAYAVGFYQGSGTNGNFTVTGVMPRATMQYTTTTNDRIVNRDVPVEGTKLYPNKALYWKTTRDAANNTNSYPGAQHIVKVRYRILDVSTEFTGAYASAQNINSSSITTISQAF